MSYTYNTAPSVVVSVVGADNVLYEYGYLVDYQSHLLFIQKFKIRKYYGTKLIHMLKWRCFDQNIHRNVQVKNNLSFLLTMHIDTDEILNIELARHRTIFPILMEEQQLESLRKFRQLAGFE